jgi:Mlc titration factor MtfA (ptsG expression regulator)
MTIILFLLLTVAGAFAYRAWSTKKLRKQLLSTTLTEFERAIVFDQVPIARSLPLHLQNQLEGKTNLFLHQVDLHGCNGLEVTKEIELSIATQACLIIMNSDAWYKNLRTVLVYPSAFRSRQVSHDGYFATNREVVRLGESWSRGPVILSWAHAAQGAANEADGHNVVLHEFAHQLDDLSGQTNGVPLLGRGQRFAEWERVFLAAYARHVDNAERGRKTVLDHYGAENHQEFFAVAIEVFFEKPAQLHKAEPEVYDQLSKLLQLNPRTWS